MLNDTSKTHNKGFSIYLTGALIGVAVTLLAICVFSLVILLFNLDRYYSIPFATVSLALGSMSASFFVARKSESRGYIIGTLIGLITFALVTIISLIINRNGLTINTLFHFIIIVLASAIGGILGVNKKSVKKYI